MNQKSLTKLEFPKIIEMLTDHASSPGGASFCRRIKPMTDLNKIITAQAQAEFYTEVLTLVVDGKEVKVKAQAVQRHPFKPKLSHIDFVRA